MLSTGGREGAWLFWLNADDVLLPGALHVNGPSSFFRRGLFNRVGGFDVSLRYCMDWDLWIRFMRAGARFVWIPHYLWAWRNHDGSKTSSNTRSEAELRRQWGEVHRMLGKNDFNVTYLDNLKLRIWRCLDGSYARALLFLLLRLAGRGCYVPILAEKRLEVRRA